MRVYIKTDIIRYYLQHHPLVSTLTNLLYKKLICCGTL